MEAAAARVACLAKEYQAEAVVVGYPLNMNGSAGFRAERTDEFISALEAITRGTPVEVVKWDERLTSAEAARTLKDAGVRHTSRKVREGGRLDIMSASILLQSYLDKFNGR
jgi:putative Holliday junction resolvase